MSSKYRLGVIGTGKPWRTEGATGFGMAHGHVKGFQKTERVDLVAVADINRENADAFAEQYGGPKVYTDYQEMLAKEHLDIVSICTWPHLHAPMTLAAAQAGVRAIHCEKPMALTWGEAQQMHQTCVERGVQLTFNHQRRFLEPFQKARQMIVEGTIGELRRIEGTCDNIYDWGTHWLDMFFFYNGEIPAEWVIGQIDVRKRRCIFGAPVEDQAICHFKFQNGVRGLLLCGFEADLGCANRIIGTEGTIEIGWQAPWLQVRARSEADGRVIETDEGIHDNVGLDRAMADVVRGLDTGERPLLSSHNAIHATEVIFATYESSRRRGRVDLPLTTPDSALVSMLEQNLIGSAQKED